MRARGRFCVTRNELERVIEPRIPFPPARIAVSDGGAAVRRKGCGIRGAVSRICGLSAEGGSRLLVFDLQALLCLWG